MTTPAFRKPFNSFQELASVLELDTLTTQLDLSDQEIDAEGEKALVTAMNVNYNLTELILPEKQVSEKTRQKVAMALIRNRRLSERGYIVQRWDRNQETEKVIECFKKLQNENPTLPNELSLAVLFKCAHTAERLIAERAALFELDEQGGAPYLQDFYHGDIEVLKLFSQSLDSEALDDLLLEAYSKKNPELASHALSLGARFRTLPLEVQKELQPQKEAAKGKVLDALDQAIEDPSVDNLVRLSELLDCWEIPEGADDLIERAFRQDKSQVVCCLLRAGLDPNIEIKGKTLLSLCSGLNDTSVALIQAGASLEGTENELFLKIKNMQLDVEDSLSHFKTELVELQEDKDKKSAELDGLQKKVLKLEGLLDVESESQDKDKKLVELDELRDRVKKLEDFLDVELADKIKAFLDHPKYGSYYKAFYNSFSSKLNIEFCSMKASLGTWTAASKTLSQALLDQVPTLAKAAFPTFGGASLIAALIIKIPQHFIESVKNDHLNNIAKTFPSPKDSAHFVDIVSYCLLTLLQHQLTFFDKPSNQDKAYLNEKAIEKFATNLVTRLFAFMFYKKHFFEEKLFWSNENEKRVVYRRAHTLALSIAWFNPNAKYKLDKKKEIPLFNTTIIRLPTTRTSSHYQRFKQKGRAFGELITDLFSAKITTTGFHHSLKTLTDKGLLQKAPFYIEENKTHVGFERCRPSQYPHLVCSDYDQAYLSAVTKKSLTAQDPVVLKTLSWHQFYEGLLAQEEVQLPLAPVASSSSTPRSIERKLVYGTRAELAEITQEEGGLREFQLRKVERKILKLEQGIKSKTHAAIDYDIQQVEDLSLLGVPSEKINPLIRRLRTLKEKSSSCPVENPKSIAAKPASHSS